MSNFDNELVQDDANSFPVLFHFKDNNGNTVTIANHHFGSFARHSTNKTGILHTKSGHTFIIAEEDIQKVEHYLSQLEAVAYRKIFKPELDFLKHR